MTGVVHALPLGPRLVALRVLGTRADAPGVATFVRAAAELHDADSRADLHEATDLVARSAQQMGLDRFRPFLDHADEHLTQTGGMVALLRDVAPFLPRVAAPAPARPPVPPGLPRQGACCRWLAGC